MIYFFLLVAQFISKFRVCSYFHLFCHRINIIELRNSKLNQISSDVFSIKEQDDEHFNKNEQIFNLFNLFHYFHIFSKIIISIFLKIIFFPLKNNLKLSLPFHDTMVYTFL